MYGYKALLLFSDGRLYSRHEVRDPRGKWNYGALEVLPRGVTAWVENEWRTARCVYVKELQDDFLHRPTVPQHEPPFQHSSDYGCGFHACATPGDAMAWIVSINGDLDRRRNKYIVAKVELAGEIIVGSLGYMAEMAKLVEAMP